jgi:hypothetical protein
MTFRPLQLLGVEKLEQIFEEEKSEVAALKELAQELSVRRSQRAHALLDKVQAAILAAHQRPPVMPDPAGTEPNKPPPAPGRGGPAKPVPAPAPIPEISLSDAYKLLKGGSSSTWEALEEQRRALVLASSPARMKELDPERQAQVRDKARLVNAAYEVISLARAEGKTWPGNAGAVAP